jgi:hypothetical protein
MLAVRLVQDTTTTTTSSGGGAALVLVILVFALAIYLLLAFAYMGIFKKTGHPTWAAFVPFVNNYYLFEASGHPGWWIFLGFIPCAGGIIALVLWIIVGIDLSKSFGKSGGFAAGVILLPFIFLYILGYGSAQYLGPAGRLSQPGGYGGQGYGGPGGYGAMPPPAAPPPPPAPPAPPM